MLLVNKFIYNDSEREVLVEDIVNEDVFGYDLTLFPEEEREIIIKASDILKSNKKFYRHFKGNKIKPHQIVERPKEQQFTKEQNGDIIINI